MLCLLKLKPDIVKFIACYYMTCLLQNRFRFDQVKLTQKSFGDVTAYRYYAFTCIVQYVFKSYDYVYVSADVVEVKPKCTVTYA